MKIELIRGCLAGVINFIAYIFNPTVGAVLAILFLLQLFTIALTGLVKALTKLVAILKWHGHSH